ncbi:hypothetical protein C8R47DRAFT_1108721 [Mycena vitilis]|nr:hypothetical protein C8R47DRAFT_1171322 [Mycena vitilis]KAJ6501037.1 hypothetical protein C8R47DRAFT_1108721 [Mycena vitilis]
MLLSRNTHPSNLHTPSAVVKSSARRASPEDDPDGARLAAFIQKIPAPIVHSYMLSHLSKAHPKALACFSAFFSDLAAPPRLHCVRCHKNYFAVENGDRSTCVIGHDDESAGIKRVARHGPQTLWGCCGKTVDGDGHMGPPDGWCYEGKHTTNTQRARFRADSTATNNMLQSCTLLRCHGRKRSGGSPDTESDSSASPVRIRTRSRTSKRAKLIADHALDGDDVDMLDVVHASLLKPKPSVRRPETRSVTSTTTPTSKRSSISRLPAADVPPSTAASAAAVPKSEPSQRKPPRSVVSTTSARGGCTTHVVETLSPAKPSKKLPSKRSTAITSSLSTSTMSATRPATAIRRAMQPKSNPRAKKMNRTAESYIAAKAQADDVPI